MLIRWVDFAGGRFFFKLLMEACCFVLFQFCSKSDKWISVCLKQYVSVGTKVSLVTNIQISEFESCGSCVVLSLQFYKRLIIDVVLSHWCSHVALGNMACMYNMDKVIKPNIKTCVITFPTPWFAHEQPFSLQPHPASTHCRHLKRKQLLSPIDVDNTWILIM